VAASCCCKLLDFIFVILSFLGIYQDTADQCRCSPATRDDIMVELLSGFESEEEEIHIVPCTESTPVENSDSLKGADISLFSPLVTKYKKKIDTLDRELALHEEKESQKKNDPKNISKNQEKEDHKKASRSIVRGPTAQITMR
jgi:hypothetical protein